MEQLFIYNNTNITFRKENGTLMVNATEMAKPFGRRPIDWLNLPSTSQFIDSLIAATYLFFDH